MLLWSLLAAFGAPAVEAAPTRLGWLVGNASNPSGESLLWSRVEAERAFARERFFVALDLQSVSILSASRDWGLGAGIGTSFSLGSDFEWAPSLRLESDVSAPGWEAVIQSSARYQLWALLLETQLGFTPVTRDKQQVFRFRQSLGLSLGATPTREDFVALDLEFQDRVSSIAAPAVRARLKRVGLSFASRVEF